MTHKHTSLRTLPVLALCTLPRVVAGLDLDNLASANYASGAAPYLSIPAHAQTTGLAGAVTAWREGMAGAQFNPAILDAADTGSMSLALSGAIMTLDRRHISFDAATSVGSFAVAGLSYTNAGVGEIEGRDEFGVRTETFDYSENAFALAAAGRLLWNISLGARARYLREDMLEEHANGMGFDAGATWQPLPQLCVGASVLNLASYLWWSTGSRDAVATEVRAGVAGSLLKNTLRMELDAAKCIGTPVDVSLGAQYGILDIVFIRAGARSAVDLQTHDVLRPEICAGLGVRYSYFGCDYGLYYPSSGLGATHRISVLGHFPVPW